VIRNLAVIPARAGSKTLKGKNTQTICGKPLLCWTVEAALNAKFFDIVVITTDIPNIWEITQSYLDPRLRIIRRAPYLCGDKIPLAPVVAHALSTMEIRVMTTFENVFTLQPTSPLRTSEDIIKAYSIYRKERADSLLSVVEEHHSIWKREGGKVKAVVKRQLNRQLIRHPYYVANGAIFITKRGLLRKRNPNRIDRKVSLYPMSFVNSIDVHTKEDFMIAMLHLTRRINHESSRNRS
jgi:CMP-N-acetylneuraminic acid synthetase